MKAMFYASYAAIGIVLGIAGLRMSDWELWVVLVLTASVGAINSKRAET